MIVESISLAVEPEIVIEMLGDVREVCQIIIFTSAYFSKAFCRG